MKMNEEMERANSELEFENSELKENNEFLKHFVRAYSSAYKVNLGDDSFEILHMNHEFQQVFTMNGSRKDMERFVEEHVHPEDRENIRKMIDRNYIKERLEKEGEIQFTMREMYNGQERTMHAVVMRGEDPNHAAIGFMDVTSEMQREKEINEKLEAAYKEVEKYREAVLRRALIAFTTNLTKDILVSGFWVNDEDVPVSLREIIGLDVPCSYDLYIKKWNDKFIQKGSEEQFIKSTDRRFLLKAFEEGKREITFDYRADTISGSERYLRRVITFSEDSDSGDIIAYTSVKDVTQEKLRENEMITQTELVNVLADKYSDVFLVFSDTGLVRPIRLSGKAVSEQDAARRMSLYGAVFSAYINSSVYKEDREDMLEKTRLSEISKHLENENDFYYHYRIKNDDALHYYYMQAVRLSQSSDYNRIVIGFACEDLEKKKEKQLEEAMIAAQKANSEKSSFLFNMSHDIRTPMNAIIGFTNMASKYMDDRTKVEDCLEKVKVSSEHLLSLINDVLDMSRVESGKVTLEEQPECLEMMVDNLISMVTGNAEERGIELHSSIDSGVCHHWIHVDRLRMMRVLTNIISNSIKYTEPGGSIWLSIEEKECSEEERAAFRFVVKDSGIGMSAEYLEHLFEPFSRAESSTKSGVVGTGLGMAITKSLIELMNGSISVKSEPGKGTEVTIDISYRIAEPVNVHEETKSMPCDSLEGMRVLLVEDNAMNCEIATDILCDEGCIVDTAEDGDIAVEKVRNSKPGQIDLILMDIQMPTMNGYEATKAIRKLEDKALASIPIIAMTANAFEEDKKNAAEAGMDGHISKPVRVKILVEMLGKVKKHEKL